jgi:hypothetical protein
LREGSRIGQFAAEIQPADKAEYFPKGKPSRRKRSAKSNRALSLRISLPRAPAALAGESKNLRLGTRFDT